MAMPRGRFPTSVRLAHLVRRQREAEHVVLLAGDERPVPSGVHGDRLGPLADVHRADTVDGTRGGELDDVHGVAVLVGHDELIDADAIVERDAHRPRARAPATVVVRVPASAARQGHRRQEDRALRYPESPVFLPPVTLPGGGRGNTDDYRRRGPRARPVGIAFDYGVGVNQFVVADENRNAVHIVKLSATGTVDGIRSVDVGKRPQAIAVNPGRDWALVTSEKDDVFGLSLSSDEVSKSDRRREAAAGHRHRPADLSGRREQLEESLGLGAGGAVPTLASARPAISTVMRRPVSWPSR